MERIAAQLYTVRKFTQTPADVAETFRKVRAIGYEAAQVSAFGPIEPAELRRVADDAGVQIVVTHTAFNRLRDDLDGVIEEHRTIACEHVAIGSMPGEMRNGEDGFHAFAVWANHVGARLREAGLDFHYHNHAFEMERFGGRTGFDILIGETDPANLGFELDTYWIQAGGGDPAVWIEKVAGRVPLLHVKDMVGAPENKGAFAEIGEGNLNWPAIVKAARAAGVEWHIVEQDTCKGDPFDSLKISLDNLRAMGVGERE